MKWSCLFVLASLIALSSPTIAQQRIALPIELTRNGSAIASDIKLFLPPGIQGRLSLNGSFPGAVPALKGLNEDVLVTPTVQGDQITLAFSITSGERKLSPTLVISKDVRGSLEWRAADGQPLTLTIAWAQ